MDALDMHVKVIGERGKDAVIDSLKSMLRHRQRADNIEYASRFFERVQIRDEEDNDKIIGHKLVKRTEDYVSSSYDLEDCSEGHGEFFYDDDGVLYPVTIGAMSRQEMGEQDIVYGSSDLIANGKVVGAVIHTDH